MKVTVTVFHNVEGQFPEENHDAVSWRFLNGYDTGHVVTPVYRFDYSAERPTYAAVCEQAFFLFNVGDDPDFGTPDDNAVAYRARKLRSLSVGDVLGITCEHRTQWFACAPSGWTMINDPHVMFGVDVHGTHSDDTLRAVPHV